MANKEGQRLGIRVLIRAGIMVGRKVPSILSTVLGMEDITGSTIEKAMEWKDQGEIMNMEVLWEG